MRYVCTKTPIVSPRARRDLYPIMEIVMSIFPTLGLVPASFNQQVSISDIQLINLTDRGHTEAILILRYDPRPIGVEAAEMEEPQGPVIYEDLIAHCNNSLVQIPIRDVIVGLAYDLYSIEKRRHHVHPTLVDK